MITGTSIRPFSMASSQAIFECCACTLSDSHGNVVTQPLYAVVVVCQKCGHLTCERHASHGLCWGCDAKEGAVTP